MPKSCAARGAAVDVRVIEGIDHMGIVGAPKAIVAIVAERRRHPRHGRDHSGEGAGTDNMIDSRGGY